MNNETFITEVEIANYNGSELIDMVSVWQLTDSEGTIIKTGSFESQNIPIGNCKPLGSIKIPLGFIKKAGKFILKVNTCDYSNQWNFWVYPKKDDSTSPSDIHICKILDGKALQILEHSGKVLLLAAGNVENGKDIIQFYTPVFWNTSWFRMRPPHTTGILINPEHPVFNNFPTDYYSDIQWWEIANKQQVMNLENFPPEFKIIVQPIDTWFMNRRLAMLFEAKVINGKLMVCSMDLSTDIEKRPVAKQLKKNIYDYMKSDDFNPDFEISVEVINELFEKKEREKWNSYVIANP